MLNELDFPPRGGASGQRELPPLTRWMAGYDLGPGWRYAPGSLLLGHDGSLSTGGRALGVLDNRHIVTIAGSRSGKTRTLLMPNLREYPGSIVVIDPKGELARTTAKFRKAMGQRVIRLDPFGVGSGTPSEQYNPFDDLSRSSAANLPADAAQLANAIIIQSGKESHWTDSARNLLIGLILLTHASDGGASIRKIRAILTDPVRLLAAWRAMAASDAYDGRLMGIGRSFLAKAEGSGDGQEGFDNRELQSILSTAQEQTRPLDDVTHISDRSDVSFDDFARVPTTVYLILPALRIATHARWLRLVIYQLLSCLERSPVPVDQANRQFPLRLVLEEFASLGHMDALETAAGYIAGFGVQLWTVLQDLTQIQTHYPKSWETFLGNAGVINAFNIVDATTTRYFSSLLGNTTILEARQAHLSTQSMRGGSPGFEASPRAVPLLEPAEIARYFARETGRQLVLVPGLSPIFMQRLPLE